MILTKIKNNEEDFRNGKIFFTPDDSDCADSTRRLQER
jgi:hypothetical protein